MTPAELERVGAPELVAQRGDLLGDARVFGGRGLGEQDREVSAGVEAWKAGGSSDRVLDSARHGLGEYVDHGATLANAVVEAQTRALVQKVIELVSLVLLTNARVKFNPRVGVLVKHALESGQS